VALGGLNEADDLEAVAAAGALKGIDLPHLLDEGGNRRCGRWVSGVDRSRRGLVRPGPAVRGSLRSRSQNSVRGVFWARGCAG
jgi:hypothetical protein